MYRLQVWYDRHWKWGINSYKDMRSAIERAEELKRVGIKSRVKLSKELFN